jgi:hypothetical protein
MTQHRRCRTASSRPAISHSHLIYRPLIAQRRRRNVAHTVSIFVLGAPQKKATTTASCKIVRPRLTLRRRVGTSARLTARVVSHSHRKRANTCLIRILVLPSSANTPCPNRLSIANCDDPCCQSCYGSPQLACEGRLGCRLFTLPRILHRHAARRP